MKIGVALPAHGAGVDGDVVRTLVLAAERLGFDGVWFADHVAVPDSAVGRVTPPFLEPLAACAWGLGATTRLRFGTDVLVAPYRHPLHVAAAAATAARLGGGRLVLGVGVGYLRGEFAALGAGHYEARGAATDEFLAALRAAWAGGGPVTFAGERVRFDDVHVLRPGVPVPVWVGGNGERAQRRAALAGDGWHPLWPSPDAYAAARVRIVALRDQAGVEGTFTWSYSCPATRVLDRARGEWPAPPPAPPPPPEFRYAPAPPRAPDGRPRFTGTAPQVAGDLAMLADAGVDHVVVRLGPGSATGVDDPVARLEALAGVLATIGDGD